MTKETIQEKYQISNITLFGSYARGENRAKKINASIGEKMQYLMAIDAGTGSVRYYPSSSIPLVIKYL